MIKMALLVITLTGCANSSINQSCVFLCRADCNTIHQEKPK